MAVDFSRAAVACVGSVLGGISSAAGVSLGVPAEIRSTLMGFLGESSLFDELVAGLILGREAVAG